VITSVICILDIFHIFFAIERPFCAGFVAPVAHRAFGSAPLIGSNQLLIDDISRVESYVRHFIKHALNKSRR